MSGLLGDIGRWVTEAVYAFGYPGIAVLMALSNLFVPVPSEMVLPLAGFLVGQGQFSFPLVLVAATAGTIASALVLYAGARRLGEEWVRRVVKRFGRYVLLHESDLDKADGWFERHGGAAVVIAWVLPGVGNLVSLPAGLDRMPVWRFVVYTALGNGLWNTAFIGAGWALGSRWEAVRRYVPFAEYAVLAAAVAAVAWFVWRRWGTRE